MSSAPPLVLETPPRRAFRAAAAFALASLVMLAGTLPAWAAEPSPSPGPGTSPAPPSTSPAPGPFSPASDPAADPSAPPASPSVPPPSPSPSVTPVVPSPPAEPPPAAPSPDPGASPAPTPPEPFSINLYRSRAFVRQYTRSWCVAAATMTMANTLRVIRRSDSWVDRTYVRQRQIIWYAKQRDTLRTSSGSDPRGWAAALRRYGGGATYREQAFDSFEAAVRHAAERLRATNRPVGILAMHGSHAWILHGFTATADPATSDDFSVTSVWVTGPLAGRDPRNGLLSAERFRERWGRYLQRDGYRGWYKRWVLVAP